MSTATQIEHPDLHLERLDVDQYHAMIDAGILESGLPVELLDGLLVMKDRRDSNGEPWTPLPDPETPGEFLQHDRDRCCCFYPLSVDQYHAMIDEGILPEGEPVELLDGLLVRKDRRDKTGDFMTVGPRHASTIAKLERAISRLLMEAAVRGHVRLQQPITLPRRYEPEPDVAIVLGRIEDFEARHPGSDDLSVVIEVADHSLPIDRKYKQRSYAGAGIREFWIVNLNDGILEVYTSPDRHQKRYGQRTDFSPGETVALDVAGATLSLPVDEFLTVAAE